MGQPHTPKVQTTSPKNGKNGLFWVRWSAIWANPGTRQTRPPTTAIFPRNTTDKSPPQQHDMSSLRVIGHVVLLWFAPCMPWYALLVRTWAYYSEPGQPRPRTEQTAHVRNSGFTCGTRWNPGRCRTRPIHDGSWGTHTQGTMQHSQELGKHDHLQQRLSHATKPKSHPASNTIYLSSKLTPTTYNTDFFAPTSRKVTLSATRSVLSPKLSPIPDKRCNSNALMSQLDKSHRGITCDIVGEPRQRSTKDRVEDGSPQERTQYGLTRHPRG